jgi:hypothetical protein
MSARAGIVTTLAFASNDERCWSVIDSFVTYHLSKGTRSLIYFDAATVLECRGTNFTLCITHAQVLCTSSCSSTLLMVQTILFSSDAKICLAAL